MGMALFMGIFAVNEDPEHLEVAPADAFDSFLDQFRRDKDWKDATRYFDDFVDREATFNEARQINVEENLHLFAKFGTEFHKINDKQCHELKTVLVNIEDHMPGRVLLTDFYNESLYTHWQFTEKPDYLRQIGALDDSHPTKHRVIISNYIQSMSNCLNSSRIYSICCRNECEDLLGHLESQIAAPMADAGQILELVAGLASDTVKAPRQLPEPLQRRLMEVAATHDGKVPLHGRLFAQWMHHAFPRECPYPHLSSAYSPQSPDEWMQQSGEPSKWESASELKTFLEETCNASGGCHKEESTDGQSTQRDLPWTSDEELLVLVNRQIKKSMDDAQNTSLSAYVTPSGTLSNLSIILLVLFAIWYLQYIGKHKFRAKDTKSSDGDMFSYRIKLAASLCCAVPILLWAHLLDPAVACLTLVGGAIAWISTCMLKSQALGVAKLGKTLEL